VVIGVTVFVCLTHCKRGSQLYTARGDGDPDLDRESWRERERERQRQQQIHEQAKPLFLNSKYLVSAN